MTATPTPGSDMSRDSDTAPAMSHGRGWAKAGFWVGVASSIAANVAHSYVPPAALIKATPAGQTVAWTPAPGAIVAAAFWPFALLISIEVVSRVAWPRAWYWWAARWVGMTAVALIAAIISYRHMSAVLAAWGEDGISSTIGPLAVDGLMVVCSGALIATLPTRRMSHRSSQDVAPRASVAPSVSHPDSPVGPTPTATATATATATRPQTLTPPAKRQPPRRPAATPRGKSDTTQQSVARQRVAVGESCATVALSLGVSKKTVERWTSDIRGQRQTPTPPSRDSDTGDADQERHQLTGALA